MVTFITTKEIVMDDREQILQKILSKIEDRKSKGKNGLLLSGMKYDDNTTKYIEKYIKENLGYLVEITKCTNCKGLWDIHIYFG